MQFPVVEDSMQFNAFEEVPSLEIPIYFFAGQFAGDIIYYEKVEYFRYLKYNAIERVNRCIPWFPKK